MLPHVLTLKSFRVKLNFFLPEQLQHVCIVGYSFWMLPSVAFIHFLEKGRFTRTQRVV